MNKIYTATHTHTDPDSCYPQMNKATEGTDTIPIQLKLSP